nr:MAG TPA_asm: hypothetical protein [Bacteriophage sp.]
MPHGRPLPALISPMPNSSAAIAFSRRCSRQELPFHGSLTAYASKSGARLTPSNSIGAARRLTPF